MIRIEALIRAIAVIWAFFTSLGGKAGKYFLSSATNLDRFANYEFRTLFNLTLRKKNGYEFGNFEETISSALGKNQRDGTLSIIGKCLAWLLDKLDKEHCRKSIKEF